MESINHKWHQGSKNKSSAQRTDQSDSEIVFKPSKSLINQNQKQFRSSIEVEPKNQMKEVQPDEEEDKLQQQTKYAKQQRTTRFSGLNELGEKKNAD